MRKSTIFALFAATSALALSACSEADRTGTSAPQAVEMAEATPPSGDAAATQSGLPGEIAIALPQLAYVYDYAFSLAGEDIRRLQRQHADLCEQQGPQSCQIVGMNIAGERDDALSGELQLLVATRHARAFGALLETEAESAGAEQVSANIATEEMSRQLVDTEAQLAARTELRDRLREVLRTRQGSVEELIAAERGVAEVNAEIDRARTWLTETRNQVAFSRMNVRYESAAPVGSSFLGPVSDALGSVSGILGVMLAMLILLVTTVGPIALVVLAIWRLTRREGAAGEA